MDYSEQELQIKIVIAVICAIPIVIGLIIASGVIKHLWF